MAMGGGGARLERASDAPRPTEQPEAPAPMPLDGEFLPSSEAGVGNVRRALFAASSHEECDCGVNPAHPPCARPSCAGRALARQCLA